MSIFEFLILTLVVLGLFFKLYRVFGTDNKNNGIKIIFRPVDKNQEKQILHDISQMIERKNEQMEAIPANLSNEKTIEKPEEFNKEMFLNGARKVFELVLNAFSQGDLSSVKELMSKKVYDAFTKVIIERKNEKITSEVDFVCFEKSEIKEVKYLKNTIKVVVEFVSEQVNLLRNKNGEIIEGDENFVQKITDMWTFERPKDAKNNIWTLVSTKKQA